MPRFFPTAIPGVTPAPWCSATPTTTARKIASGGPRKARVGTRRPPVHLPPLAPRRLATQVSRILRFLPFVLAVATLCAPARANDLDNVLYTVGTSTTGTDGQPWAYVLWQAGDATQVFSSVYAVVAKPGPATSVSPYTLRGVVETQTNELTIQALLQRGKILGDDLVALEDRVRKMFGAYAPEGLPLPDTLGALQQVARTDVEVFNNLMLLARLHPSVALTLGLGFAEKIPPGLTTFEIRQCPAIPTSPDQDCQRVIGRVTVDSTAPLVLPAPGPIFGIALANAQGDRNVRLRWSTPDPLRRLALLQFGFDIYRIRKAYGDSLGYDAVAPLPAEMLDLAATQPDEVVKVNRLPILIARDLSVSEANDGCDTETFFALDDNRRFLEGGQPFADGDQFYYFAAARDALGRPGNFSPPVLITICERIAPPFPRGVKVTNDYQYHPATQTSTQVLKVTWKQNDHTDEKKTSAYYVYRWNDTSEVTTYEAPNLAAAFLIAGPIAHQPGQDTLSVLDNGLGAPAMPGDAGRTFWYTVRAVDGAACGDNYSPNSAAVFGVLRDRVGPDKPTGNVTIWCGEPVISHQENRTEERQPTPRPGCLSLEFSTQRQSPAISWVEYYLEHSSLPEKILLGRAYFDKRTHRAILRKTLCDLQLPPLQPGLPRTDGPDDLHDLAPPFLFSAVAGSNHGALSAPAYTQLSPVDNGATYIQTFVADFALHPARTGQGGPCDLHVTIQPGSLDGVIPGQVNPIDINLGLTPTAKEWKLYRRLNNGPLTLIKQGLDDYDVDPNILVQDVNLPQTGALLCYYLQVYDEHGNASPMTRLEDCVRTTSKTDPATPILSPVQPEGDESNPRATLTWFCPPAGLERFIVYIGIEQGNLPAVDGFQIKAGPTLEGIIEGVSFTQYRTGRVGSDFGQGPEFTLEVPIALGKKYTFFVEAVTPAGQHSVRSNFQPFSWYVPVVPGPNVPWPARGLPDVDDVFDGQLEARFLQETDFQGGAILIGEILDPLTPGLPRSPPSATQNTPPGQSRFSFPGSDPTLFLFRDNLDRTALPSVLYRYQVVNDNHATVPGDLYQVSPLLEEIAGRVENGRYHVYDPFFYALRRESAYDFLDLFLLDTQPVIRGAAYKYLLVRYDALGEIDVVIPLGPVEIITPL